MRVISRNFDHFFWGEAHFCAPSIADNILTFSVKNLPVQGKDVPRDIFEDAAVFEHPALGYTIKRGVAIFREIAVSRRKIYEYDDGCSFRIVEDINATVKSGNKNLITYLFEGRLDESSISVSMDWEIVAKSFELQVEDAVQNTESTGKFDESVLQELLLLPQLWVSADNIKRLPIKEGSIQVIVMDNPYVTGGDKNLGSMNWLSNAAEMLALGGKLPINAEANNPYARLPSVQTLENLGLRVVQEPGPLLPEFKEQTFHYTDGSIIEIDKMQSTVLEKIH